MVFPRLVALLLALGAVQAQAIEPFTIKDIRVEGIQRTEAGTVFSYLPVKVGDVMTDEKASQAIRALFATGFFRGALCAAAGHAPERVEADQRTCAGMREGEATEIVLRVR